MSRSPWIKFFASDFLNGIADLDADEIGVYTVILSLMWDRGAPIPDDGAWIARRAGTSTRRFNQIRAKLIGLGKLESRNAMLGNRRAIEVIEERDKKSDQTRAAAIMRWHGHAEPELPLGDDETADYLKNKREKTKDKNVLESRKSDKKPLKSAKSDNTTASSPSRARATPELEVRINTTDSIPLTPEDPPESLPHDDLTILLQAVSEASGYHPNPSRPEAYAKAIGTIAKWRDAGIDFDRIIIPTIKRIVADTGDPTSSLNRFNKQILHEHARARASPNANGYRAPSPIYRISGEPDAMVLIRTEFAKAIGADAYVAQFNDRLSLLDKGEGIIEVAGPQFVRNALMDNYLKQFKRIAARYGYARVW